MIRHCVFVRFRAGYSTGDRQSLYQALAELVGRLPGCSNFTAGTNCTAEPGMDKDYNGGFTIDFIEQSALKDYLSDPGHQIIGARLIDAAEGGSDGVMVFDFDMANEYWH